MSERCPICDKDECQHTDDEKELVKLRAEVEMLNGAIEGWRSHSERLERELSECEWQRGYWKDRAVLGEEWSDHWKAEAEKLAAIVNGARFAVEQVCEFADMPLLHLAEAPECHHVAHAIHFVKQTVAWAQNARAALGEGGK